MEMCGEGRALSGIPMGLLKNVGTSGFIVALERCSCNMGFQAVKKLVILPKVWRNCAEDYRDPVSIWLPRPPEGYVALGCVAISTLKEPPLHSAFCVNERFAEDAVYEEQIVWASSDAYPWGCYVYQIQSKSLQFMALRLPKEDSELKPKKVSESYAQQALERS